MIRYDPSLPRLPAGQNVTVFMPRTFGFAEVHAWLGERKWQASWMWINRLVTRDGQTIASRFIVEGAL